MLAIVFASLACRHEAARARTRCSVCGSRSFALCARRPFGKGAHPHAPRVRDPRLTRTPPRARSVYTANIIITLAAAEDYRMPPLHGVQTLARLSLYTMQTFLSKPATSTSGESGYGDSLYGAGSPSSFVGADKRDLLIVISVLDVAAMLVILISVAWFRHYMRAALEREAAETLTLDDYSLVVHGLPREVLHKDELIAHLEAAHPDALHGKIADVFIGKNFGEFLERLTARGQVLEALDSLNAMAAAKGKDVTKQRTKLMEKLAKLDKDMAALDESKLVCVNAYVTFSTVEARNAALAAWPGGPVRAALPFLLSKQRRFRGAHNIRMTPAPEPSTVLWENIQYSAASRQARQAVAGFVTFGLLLITVGFITGAKDFEKQMPPQVACADSFTSDQLDCDALFNLTATVSSSDPQRVNVDKLSAQQNVRGCDSFISASTGVWTDAWTSWADNSTQPATVLPAYVGTPTQQCAAKICQGCYCESQGFFPWLENKKDLYSYCDVFWQNYINNWVLKGLSIVSVIVINATFAALIPVLSRFEKLHSRGELDTSIAVKTYLSAFFNAFVVTLLVYAFIVKLEEFPLVFKGAYADFTPAWYANIGSSLFVTTFTQAVQPPVQSMVIGWVTNVLRRFQIKSQYTQRDLNKLMAGPQWLLSTRVAQLLTATSLAIVLCGGFPGAGFLLCICAGMSYRADKYILLRVARAPPRYGPAMVERLLGVLVWCVWLHFGLTAWMFGDSALSAYHLHNADKASNVLLSRGDFGQFNVGERLEKWQCLVHSLPHDEHLALRAAPVWWSCRRRHQELHAETSAPGGRGRRGFSHHLCGRGCCGQDRWPDDVRSARQPCVHRGAVGNDRSTRGRRGARRCRGGGEEGGGSVRLSEERETTTTACVQKLASRVTHTPIDDTAHRPTARCQAATTRGHAVDNRHTNGPRAKCTMHSVLSALPPTLAGAMPRRGRCGGHLLAAAVLVLALLGAGAEEDAPHPGPHPIKLKAKTIDDQLRAMPPDSLLLIEMFACVPASRAHAR